jgi:hypothetical protein
MPFKSKAQKRFLYLKHPKVAKKFAEETDDYSKLPEKAKSKKKSPWMDMGKKKEGE